MLFDRGGRELPIAPDFVGSAVDVEPSMRLEVELDERGAPLRARVAPRGGSGG